MQNIKLFCLAFVEQEKAVDIAETTGVLTLLEQGIRKGYIGSLTEILNEGSIVTTLQRRR